MAKKKIIETESPKEIKHAEVLNQAITDTLEKNFMPYAMSVIISRAIPEIDGLKPAHRKLLYTMYKMGLLSSSAHRTKSANIVGQTMRLNPHGDSTIYETLVRLTRGNEALLHPLIDSKGSFGKQYSRDMAYAASRYTECKLDAICNEFFDGIDRDTVDFIDNYDNTMKEPALLPTSFPNILVSPNQGVAVSIASQICSFNLAEICDTTIQLLKNPETPLEKIMQILKAPDFSTGGQIIYDEASLREIYTTGEGSVKLRAKYTYDKSQNCIDIYQIPYTATVEAIQDKIEQLVKDGKIKEINDIRDETDLGGLKITIDLKRGVEPDKIMGRLFKTTQLESNFVCNFNVLIDSVPKQIGVLEILNEWISFRLKCVKRELAFDLNKQREKLHLLYGLRKILLDIDKVIGIIRNTAKEAQVIPNIMKAFELDTVQAEYIAEIRLRSLNREYIVNRTKEIETIEKEAEDIESVISSEDKQKKLIIKQLENVKKKYGKDRLTEIIYTDEAEDTDNIETIENYTIRVILSREGYFKKITMLSLRGNDEQKLKDGDEIIFCKDVQNIDDILFFTDKGQVYKSKLYEFDNVKASVLGDYIPARMSFDEGEKIVYTIVTSDYSGNLLLFFKNGKVAKIPLEVYKTKTNRKKLTSAYSTVSPIFAIYHFADSSDCDFLLVSSENKAICINSALISLKTTRTTIGVDTLLIPKVKELVFVTNEIPQLYQNKSIDKLRKTKIPVRGVPLDAKEQISIYDM